MATKHSTTKTVACDTLPLGKVVRYNRENKDFDFYFDQQYLGSRTTEHDARECLNEYVYDLERSGAMYTATALDSGNNLDACAVELAATLVEPPSAPVTPLALTVEPIYRESNGDLTGTPTDTVAYLDYRTSIGKDKVIVSVAVDNNEEPEILLFGRDGVSLSRFLAAVETVQRILETVAAAQEQRPMLRAA